MSRPIFTLSLYRPNRHVEPGAVGRLTGKLIVESAILAFLVYVIAALVLL